MSSVLFGEQNFPLSLRIILLACKSVKAAQGLGEWALKADIDMSWHVFFQDVEHLPYHGHKELCTFGNSLLVLLIHISDTNVQILKIVWIRHGQYQLIDK